MLASRTVSFLANGLCRFVHADGTVVYLKEGIAALARAMYTALLPPSYPTVARCNFRRPLHPETVLVASRRPKPKSMPRTRSMSCSVTSQYASSAVKDTPCTNPKQVATHRGLAHNKHRNPCRQITLRASTLPATSAWSSSGWPRKIHSSQTWTQPRVAEHASGTPKVQPHIMDGAPCRLPDETRIRSARKPTWRSGPSTGVPLTKHVWPKPWCMGQHRMPCHFFHHHHHLEGAPRLDGLSHTHTHMVEVWACFQNCRSSHIVLKTLAAAVDTNTSAERPG